MFLNILPWGLQLQANVLKLMFLNVFVGIGCAVVILRSAYKPTGSTNMTSLNWPLPLPARNKKRFEASLYMHNTKGDVTVMNISREKNICMISCSIQNKLNYWPVLCFRMFFKNALFKNFVLRVFSASVCSYNVLFKNIVHFQPHVLI